jgi:hypothetical protein
MWQVQGGGVYQQGHHAGEEEGAAGVPQQHDDLSAFRLALAVLSALTLYPYLVILLLIWISSPGETSSGIIHLVIVCLWFAMFESIVLLRICQNMVSRVSGFVGTFSSVFILFAFWAANEGKEVTPNARFVHWHAWFVSLVVTLPQVILMQVYANAYPPEETLLMSVLVPFLAMGFIINVIFVPTCLWLNQVFDEPELAQPMRHEGQALVEMVRVEETLEEEVAGSVEHIQKD